MTRVTIIAIALLALQPTSAQETKASSTTAPEAVQLSGTPQPRYRFVLPTQQGNLWGWVDEQGQLLLKPQYLEMYNPNSDAQGNEISVARNIQGQFGYIDPNGKVLHPFTLDNARSLTEMGLARFEKDDKWGYVDAKGQVVIEPKFDYATPMENGFAVVQTDEKKSYIDVTGKPAFKGKYYSAGEFSNNGLAAVRSKKNGKMGYIDTNGKIAIKQKFSYASKFAENGLATAATGDGVFAPQGVINTQGDWVIKPTFYDLGEFNDKGLAVFKNDSQKSGLIDSSGKKIYQGSDYDISVNTHCDALHHGYYSIKFASLAGEPIKELNEPSFDYFTGFLTDDCRGLTINNGRWSWIGRDGSNSALDKKILEPYASNQDPPQAMALDSSFIPGVTRNRELVYFNREGQIVLTTSVKKGPKADTIVVRDVSGNELWQSNYPTGTLIEQHPLFFKPGNPEFGFNDDWAKDIQPVVDQLLVQKPRYFDNFLKDPYATSSVDVADASFGTIKMLAYHYLSEFSYGTYDFMSFSGDFSSQFDAIEKQLRRTYGKPIRDKDEEWEAIYNLNFYSGDGGDGRAWKIDDSYLVLDNATQSGDGDITSTLKIAVLPTQESPANAIDLSASAYALIETEDESDDDVHSAVKELSQNTGNPRFVRDQANRIFALIEGGSDISEYDYLWTLYALLSAAYPELPNGMPQEDYLKIADTAFNYLNNNGVGTWVFTELGQFQMEVYRNAGNGAAWTLRESDPKRALPYIESAMHYMRDEDMWMNDTYVRVLLNLEQADKAFAIVEKVLAEDPDFSDFQDFTANQQYQTWLKKN